MTRREEINRANRRLLSSVEADDLASVEAALRAGAEADTATDQRGDAAIHIAARRGNDKILRKLIEYHADVDVRDKSGNTALIVAAEYRHEEACLTLIEHNADVNAKNISSIHSGGQTALMRAANTGLIEICRKLIERGADVHARDDERNTALIWAAELGHEDICQFLIENDADIEARNRSNEGAVYRAFAYNRFSTVKLLLRSGARSDNQTLWLESINFAGNLKPLQEEMAASAKKAFPIGKPLIANDCLQKHKPTEALLDACAIGLFGVLVAAPLINSDKPEDRRLFQNMWEVLPPRWKGEYALLQVQFLKAGGVRPVIGPFTEKNAQENAESTRGVN